MQFIVDLVLIVLFAFVVYRSVSKGFFLSLFDGCSIVLSGFVSYKLCPAVSGFFYNHVVYDLMRSRFSNTLDNLTETSATADRVAQLIKALPQGAVRMGKILGVDAQSIAKTFPKEMTDSEMISTVMSNITNKVMLYATEAVVFFILFIIFCFIFKLISKAFNSLINKVALTKSLNDILGGVFGVIKGLLLVAVVCALLYFIHASSSDPKVVSAIGDSKIYEFAMRSNPLSSLF